MRRALVTALVGSAAWAQSLVFVEAPATQELGMTGSPVVIEFRRGGVADPPGSTMVTFTTEDGGGFESVVDAPNGTQYRWVATRAVGAVDGGARTAALYFRAARPGSVDVIASAPGYGTARTTVLVSPFVFALDFEDGFDLRDVPPGPINHRFNSVPAPFCGVVDGGALRGDKVLLLDDQTLGFQASRVVGTQPLRRTLYFRGWIREDPGPLGNWTVVELSGDSSTDPAIISSAKELFAITLRGNVMRGQAGRTPTTDVILDVPRPDAGQFHLYEIALLAVGTTDAGVRWSVDGEELPRIGPHDWSSVHRRLVFAAIGGVFKRATGGASQTWWDDTALAARPLASSLSIEGPSRVDAGACVVGSVTPVGTFAGEPEAMWPFDLDLLVDAGNAEVFADESCDASVVTLHAPKGGSRLNFGFRGLAGGVAALSLSNPSLLIAPTYTMTVDAPDAGQPDAGLEDAGSPDAGSPDSGSPDAGSPDAGSLDAGSPDAGSPDAGLADAGTIDGGEGDGGEGDGGADGGAPVEVIPDGGLVPTPTLAVGCSCSELPIVAAFIGSLALLPPRRRRWTR